MYHETESEIYKEDDLPDLAEISLPSAAEETTSDCMGGALL